MEPFGHIAGYAGATYGALQLGSGAVLGAIAARVPDANQVPMALIFILSPMLAWTLCRIF